MWSSRVVTHTFGIPFTRDAFTVSPGGGSDNAKCLEMHRRSKIMKHSKAAGTVAQKNSLEPRAKFIAQITVSDTNREVKIVKKHEVDR